MKEAFPNGDMVTTAQPANASCWAAPLGDCAQKITREHIVSQCLFEDDQIMVQGLKWCLNEPKSIGSSSLVAKILCKNHNSGLSDLDAAALQAFNVFRESIRLNQVREKLKRPPTHWNIKRMEIDGPLLERWFLKTLINLTFGGEWPIGSNVKGTPSRELVEVAFGRRQFEHGAGLYLAGRAGEQIDSMDRVNFTPMTDKADNLAAGRFNFRGYTFFLCLVPEKFEMLGDSHLLYREVTLNCSVQERSSHVIAIKGWPPPPNSRAAEFVQD
ncbi:MAG: hypothetical protein WA188_10740 [Terriglobales bacterium]